jgi:ABC-2 type transport system ATP-binding protein
MTQENYALEVEGLVKRFDRPAVNGLTLRVKAREFYALLGPNGAGKTTTLRIVAGLLAPDAGSVRVCGIDVAAMPVAAKQRMAWVPDEPILYDKLTPFEYLEFIAALWGMDPASAEQSAVTLLKRFDLGPHLHERCEGFSKGMRQKVTLAGALIHNPELIILDEPLTGLDAGAARMVKQVLSERVQAGAAIVMTTHILEVAERMAERIGIIHHGQLLAEGTMTSLQRQAGQERGTLEDIFLSLVAASSGAA